MTERVCGGSDKVKFCAVELERGADDARVRDVLRDVLGKSGVKTVFFSDESDGLPVELANKWTPVPDGRTRLVAWGLA